MTELDNADFRTLLVAQGGIASVHNHLNDLHTKVEKALDETTDLDTRLVLKHVKNQLEQAIYRLTEAHDWVDRTRMTIHNHLDHADEIKAEKAQKETPSD